MRIPKKPNKTALLLLSLACLFALLLTLYLAVLSPMFAAGEQSTTTTRKLEEGEGLGITTILMFPRVERASMAKIEVFYQYDADAGEYLSYSFRKDADDQNGDGDTNDFIITDHATKTYDEERFSGLVVDVGYTACLGKLEGLDFSAGADEVYGRYGLSLSAHPAYYELTTTEGAVYRVYVGAKTPDGNYYARLDGREAIYILTASLEDSVLAPLSYFVSPTLTWEGESSYAYVYTKNFAIFHDASLKDLIFGGGTPDVGKPGSTLDPFVMFTYMNSEERDLYHASSIYAMMAPSNGYTANDSRVDLALQKLPGLTGTETLKLGLTDSDFAEGGLLEDLAYTVYYEMPYSITFDDNEDPVVGRWVTNLLFVSERHADGTYTVGSLCYENGKEDKIVHNLIARVEHSELSFLTYSLFDWIEGRMFSVSIDNVAKMEFSSSYGDYIFDLAGDGTAGLVVTERNSGYRWFYHSRGTPFAVNEDGYCEDVAQFRQLYLLLLSLQYAGSIEEDSGMSDEEIADIMQDDSACMMTFILTMEDGREMTYRFFPYSERHAMVSVTGDGITDVVEFYTGRQAVRRIASATYDLMHGIEIDSDRRY